MFTSMIEHHNRLFTGGGLVLGASTVGVSEVSNWFDAYPALKHFVSVIGGILMLIAWLAPKIQATLKELKENTKITTEAKEAAVAKTVIDSDAVKAMNEVILNQRQLKGMVELRYDVSDQVQQLISDVAGLQKQGEIFYKGIREQFNGLGQRLTDRMDKVEEYTRKVEERVTKLEGSKP